MFCTRYVGVPKVEGIRSNSDRFARRFRETSKPKFNIDYALEALKEFHAGRETLRGLRIIEESPTLRRFTVKFEEL